MTPISHILGSNRAISFPLGKPPKGTCDFATKTCLQECGGRLPNFDPEHQAYQSFRELPVEEIVGVLRRETEDKLLLSWFPESGDCPKSLTAKVVSVMAGLVSAGVRQNGFTRNRILWEQSHSFAIVRLVLTEEDAEIAEQAKTEGLVAVPDYYERRVTIYNNNTVWLCGGGSVVCGCGFVEDDGKTSEEDCGICMNLKRGCFAVAAA